MEKFQKVAKEDINFPLFCLIFIKKIQEQVDNWGYDENYYAPIVVEIKIPCPYCSDAFKLIEKTFERQGLNMSPPSCVITTEGNLKYYTYKLKFSYWTFNGEYDNLPF
jgi:hypothetical protein